ncbi:MAG TPA: calcium-binding protein, partial [Sphingomonas sp.]|nr:calcium-binding protein [Sphingomonas sp.]
MVDLYAFAGGEVVVNTTRVRDQRYSRIGHLADGGYVVSWQSFAADGTADVYFQRYDSSGVAQGSETLANSTSVWSQITPSVTGLAGGGFVVTWEAYDRNSDTSHGVFMQRYDAAGVAQGGETQVNTIADGSNGNMQPVVTALTGGGYVVTWTSYEDTSYDVYTQRYDASGVAQGGHVRVNSYLPGTQFYPATTAMADGGYVVAWESFLQDGSDGGIYVQRFDASGAPQGVETRVNTTTLYGQLFPDIAALNDGSYVVTWQSTIAVNQTGTFQVDVYAQHYGANNLPIGGETLINSYTAGNQQNTAITALATGGYVITWQSPLEDGSGLGVYAQFFDANGVAQGSEIRVNSTTAGDQDMPQVTSLVDGSVVFTWEGAGNGYDIYTQRIVPSAAPTAVVLSSSTIYEADVSGIALITVSTVGALNAGSTLSLIGDSSGAFSLSNGALSLTDPTRLDHETAGTVNLTIRSTDANGHSFDQALVLTVADSSDETRFAPGAEQLVNTATTGDQSLSAGAALAGGGYVVVYAGATSNVGTTPDVLMQRYDENGNKLGGEVTVNTATLHVQTAPSVAALSDGGYVVAWQSNAVDHGLGSSGISIQRYDANGVAQGGEVVVDSPIGGDIVPSVTGLTGGGFVVTWSENHLGGGNGLGIFAQRYDASGTAQGAKIAVNSYFGAFEGPSVVAATSSGGFVIAWQSANEDGSSNGIYMQRYDASGVAQGGETRVNTTTLDSQEQPAIVALSGGGYVVAWASHGQDGDGYGIYMQRYDNSGTALGGETLVNSHIAGDQTQPSLTALASGGYAVTWTSAGEDGSGQGIYMQRFDANGVAQSSETLINAVTAQDQSDSAVIGLAGGNIVTLWSDNSLVGGDSSGLAVKMRELLAQDVPMGVDLNGAAAGLGNAFTFTAHDAATAMAPNALVTDGPGNLKGGVVYVSFVSGSSSDDQIVILNQGNGAGQISSSGGTLYYGGVAVGTVSGGADGAALLVNFTSYAANEATLQALLRAIAFANAAATPTYADRVVQFDIGDGHGGAYSGGLSVTIGVASGAAPAVASDDANATTANAAIIGASVLGNDHDSDGPALQVGAVNGSAANVGTQITLASGALLTLRADGSYDYNPNHAFDSLTTVSGATNSSASDSFTYTLVGGNTATVTVTVNAAPGSASHALGSAGNDTMTGSGSADYFDLSQGGNDSASGGDGNDAFFMGAALTAADHLDGGVGSNDQIALQGDYSGGNKLVLGANTIAGIEVMTALAGFSYDITSNDGNVAAGATLAIYASTLGAGDSFTFNGSAETDGKFLVYGGLGADTITTGAGSDGIYFGRDGRFNPATDHVDGGGGSDQLALEGDYTVTISNASVTNVELLSLLDGLATHSHYNITLADDWTAAGQTHIVYGVVVRDGFTLDASAESDGNLTVYGGLGNDTITTGAGNDW